MNNEILIKFLLKESSSEENERVKTWLSEGEENRVHFKQLQQIWMESEQLKSSAPVDADVAWQKFKAKTEQSSKGTTVTPLRRNYAWIGIAAALFVAVGTWMVISMFAYQEIKSDGEVLTRQLPDGSELTINKNSMISYASNFRNNRSLRLEKGEVFFNVEPDQKHPFVIEIDEVNVQVVGTSFNIKRLKGATEIVVETGIVKVNNGTEEIKLVKGEKVVIGNAAKSLHKEKIDNHFYNYYRTKLFVANNTPLPELVTAINEAYGSNIILDGESKKTRISITLEYGSLDDNLRYIAATLNLKISRNQHEIRLSYP